MTIVTTRRNFLISAGATGAVLIVGFAVDGALASGAADAEINPFVRILPDGKIQVVLKHFEMGQGTSTGLATLVAEEMDADWDKVTTDFAPADDARYKNLFFGAQGTGGSTAIANSFMQYRQAGAAARELLVAAAANTWGVQADSVTSGKQCLKSGGKVAHFGEMAAKADCDACFGKPKVKGPFAVQADRPRGFASPGQFREDKRDGRICDGREGSRHDLCRGPAVSPLRRKTGNV